MYELRCFALDVDAFLPLSGNIRFWSTPIVASAQVTLGMRSGDYIGKFMDVIVKAGQKGCPIALVRMQKTREPVAVMQREASERAAELGAMHFPVQTAVSDQVMAPFIYLGLRHIQGRNKASWLLKIEKLRSLWHVSLSSIWSCWACCVSR